MINNDTNPVIAVANRAMRRSVLEPRSRGRILLWDRLRLLNLSLTWSPSVALSWLWGLGFFYSIHVTIEDGWLGFLCFATPNSAGLLLFGWLLGAGHRDPTKIMAKVQRRYYGLFLLAQTLALAVTIFGFVAYLWRPMFLSSAMTPLGLAVLVGCGVGHVSSVRTIKRIHFVYLGVGVCAALFTLASLRGTDGHAPISLASFGGRFYGLLAPMFVGLLLGPWMDIQQWQRATEIHREGGSIRLAYTAGAILFFALLSLNALLAVASGHAGVSIAADGIADTQPAVALAIVGAGLRNAAIGYAIWAVIATISTIDSSYVATRWMMTTITASSKSPLLAFIPGKLLSSSLWVVMAAIAVGAAALICNLSMMYLMAPFATLMVGAAASLVSESLGARGNYDPTFAYLTGLAAGLVLLQGYLNSTPAFEAIAPFIALTQIFVGRSKQRAKERVAAAEAGPSKHGAIGAAPASVREEAATAAHGFDGRWFEMRITPTYDDTNAVGNVYFANYIRWVGRARELFFNVCMPNFDLTTTNYYVFTRSFHHDFRREAKEFEDVTVRVKIGKYNRKFVTLQHEIVSAKQGTLGHGEQTLMFVDRKDFRALDIPRAIIQGFLPFWPKSSPLAASLIDDATDGVAPGFDERTPTQ